MKDKIFTMRKTRRFKSIQKRMKPVPMAKVITHRLENMDSKVIMEIKDIHQK